MKMQITNNVCSLPLCSIELTSILLIKLTTGFPDCCVSAPNVDEPVLKINSRKGINIPIETIEKIIDRTVNIK